MNKKQSLLSILLMVGLFWVGSQEQALLASDSEEITTPDTTIPATIATHLVLKLDQKRVYIYQGEQEIDSYPVAIGKKGWETPTGNYKVIQMIKNPSWQHPWTGEIFPAGPDNPLGERWIGFWTDGRNFIGFHGTPSESLIGQAVSHGCVRMRNQDIIALFKQVKIGTSVIVQP